MAPAHRTDLRLRRELNRLALQGEDTVRTAQPMIMHTSLGTSGTTRRRAQHRAHSLWREVKPRFQVGVTRRRAELLGFKHCSCQPAPGRDTRQSS